MNIFELALRPIMRGWLRQVFRNLADVPRPMDDPRVHASGVDSDRVLLLGAGAAVGWGVLSHDLALPGSLARGLSSVTGRGADVDVVAEPTMSLAATVGRLGALDLTRYDAIVLTLGLNEAASLAPVSAWRRDLESLAAYLAEAVPRTPIFLVGVHQITQIGRYDAMVAPIVAHHRNAMNRVSRQVSAHREHFTFIPFEPPQRAQRNRYRSKSEYREGGILLASIIAPALNAAVAMSRPARAGRSALDTLARRNALDEFGILDATRQETFERLTEFARLSLHTSAAKITILGSSRFWTVSSRGVVPTEGPRNDSICFTAIDHEDAFVVADASRDPRFADMRHINGPPPVRFYAGYRFEAPNGVPIGVLCVQDSVQRDIGQFDRALLRDIALLVQREIWLAAQSSTPSGYVSRRQPAPVAIPFDRTYAPVTFRS